MGAEYQEQITILIDKQDNNIVRDICIRENIPYTCIGNIINSNQIIVYDGNKKIVDLNLNDILENVPQKKYYFNEIQMELNPLIIPVDNLLNHIEKLGFKVIHQHFFLRRGDMQKQKFQKVIPDKFYEYRLILQKIDYSYFKEEISNKYSNTYLMLNKK